MALPGALLVQRLTERMAGPPERDSGPSLLPALALSLALVSFAVGCAGNVLSRKVEASADEFALRLTDEPAAFIALERRLALSNVSQPDPPALTQLLFGTHPTTVSGSERGAWARRDGSASSSGSGPTAGSTPLAGAE